MVSQGILHNGEGNPYSLRGDAKNMIIDKFSAIRFIEYGMSIKDIKIQGG